jgi:hypothetical protein
VEEEDEEVVVVVVCGLVTCCWSLFGERPEEKKKGEQVPSLNQRGRLRTCTVRAGGKLVWRRFVGVEVAATVEVRGRQMAKSRWWMMGDGGRRAGRNEMAAFT